MTAHALIVIYLVALRVGEVIFARANTRRLVAMGGREAGASHYPAIVVLHASWLAAIAFWIPTATAPDSMLLGAFAVVQFLRFWVVGSLGRRWTTRIIVLPGAPLRRRGPYRWLRHPNYVVVVIEIALVPLVFGAWPLALVFSVLNGVVLWVRIKAEEQALAEIAPKR